MNKIALTGNIILIVFAICGALILGGTLYYYFNDTTETVETKSINTLTYAEGQKFAMELNYYSNEKYNGKMLFEVKINYYTDVSIPTEDDHAKPTHSTGAQFVDEVKMNHVYTMDGAIGLAGSTWFYEPVNAYLYNADNAGVGFSAIDKLDYQDSWIIDMDGGLGLITQREAVEANKVLWFSVKNRDDIWAMILNLYEVVQSLNEGTQVLQLALSDYLLVKPYDGKQFSSTPVTEDNTDYTYVNVLVNKSNNGATEASQSLFGVVEKNAEWSATGAQPSDYWQSKTVKVLTINDFDITDSNTLILKEGANNYLAPFTDAVFKVVLDLSDYQITAFEAGCFRDLDIQYLFVNSSVAKSVGYHQADFAGLTIVTNNVTLEVIA